MAAAPILAMDEGKSVLHHVDPSKLRIFLCDTNAESCRQILSLLCKCSYQDTIWSRAEVFPMLSTRGALADIIIAEIGLLMADDAHLLRYIMRDETLQRIPVVILTKEDEVSVTVKALRLGAAAYLLNPLHCHDLSNLHILLQNY